MAGPSEATTDQQVVHHARNEPNAQLVSAIEQELASTRGALGDIDMLWDRVLGRKSQALRAADSDAQSSSGDEDGASVDKQAKKRPGKRGRRRKDDDEHLLDRDDLDLNTKRKLQNRAAQRSFRERKERHLQDLERRVIDQTEQITALKSVCQKMRDGRLFIENQTLHTGQPVQRGAVQISNGTLPSPESTSNASPPRTGRTMPTSAMTLSAPAATMNATATSSTPSLDRKPSIDEVSPVPPMLSSFEPAAGVTQDSPYLNQSTSGIVTAPSYAQTDNMSPSDFDFDAPFDISDAVPLPPLFQSFLDQYTASLADPQTEVKVGNETGRGSSQTPYDSVAMDDACPGIDDEPPPLPNGKLPCPECDFSSVSCALPMPWRPPNIDKGIASKDVWVSQKAWAKLCSHPLFHQCDVNFEIERDVQMMVD
ncbi:BZIP domain-containing protein [Microbotryomycetes sp. JL201]|nr:BZIP domain-containing protein [Microbotryomycetes sp. JL201]